MSGLIPHKKATECLRAAGRACDGDDLRRLGTRTSEENRSSRGRGRRVRVQGRPADRRAGYRGWRDGGRGGPARRREASNLGDQIAAEFRVVAYLARSRRLGDVVGGARLHRPQAGLRIVKGQRRRHDDIKARVVLQQLGKRRQAIHHRHLDIQDHHVDVVTWQRRQRRPAVGDGRDDLDAGFAFQYARDQPAHDRGSVHHHDPGGTRRQLSRHAQHRRMGFRFLTTRASAPVTAGRSGRTWLG